MASELDPSQHRTSAFEVIQHGLSEHQDGFLQLVKIRGSVPDSYASVNLLLYDRTSGSSIYEYGDDLHGAAEMYRSVLGLSGVQELKALLKASDPVAIRDIGHEEPWFYQQTCSCRAQ
jgi:hypothetical protein